MKISYSWLIEYFPIDEAMAKIIGNPQKIAEILTSVGLEVENLEKYEQIRNGLEGLVIGEVLTCEKHPDADKLKITTVDTGSGDPLQIVCGASNVAVGQKVIVATVGATLYPVNGEPFNIKKAKIRGVASNGMLCAEDEIGLGNDHEGILVLPAAAITGTSAGTWFKLFNDWIFEIGLTPNRMDAMSHLGVAKDVCAYLSHHHNRDMKVITPFTGNFKPDDQSRPVKVEVPHPGDCERYAGISISGITVGPSPEWLQHKLRSIGLRPLNNVVDITNFILHETGQPLHAFDLDKIKGEKIIVETLPEGTPFITLDGKERKLSGSDIMICNGDHQPMCIAGVFGGMDSGVSDKTTNLFLESAVFNAASVRKTMLYHNLRTEAAVRFEKGINIGLTATVLMRAALLIKEIAGGKITSAVTDVYPVTRPTKEISLTYQYLKKISGKNYHPDAVINILKALNFIIVRQGIDEITVSVPFSNPDISLPADLVEEVMRIDGLDNIQIPAAIRLSPAIDNSLKNTMRKEKVAGWLSGNGFHEIFTNSITNSKYFDETTLSRSVGIINSLSEGLNVMRPSMLPTGLECISYNLNRKNNNLLFFEFGKTYSKTGDTFDEEKNLAIYASGGKNQVNWNLRPAGVDIYFMKGIASAVFSLLGIKGGSFTVSSHGPHDKALNMIVNDQEVGTLCTVSQTKLDQFSIKQPVYYLSFSWDRLLAVAPDKDLSFEPVARFPQVQRDLSIVIDKNISFGEVEELVKSLQLSKLESMQLFDVFENEKLGVSKKSLAFNFVFSDKEKTLTDKEIENRMDKIITLLENRLGALIRRNA